jgi:CSLREA domain-containing protein
MKTRLWKWNEVSAVTLPIVFSLLGLIGAVFQAHASTTIAVSTNSDTVADDGLCSLREAIAAANTDTASGSSSGECPAGSGSDTITIPSIEISLGSRLIISSPIALVGVGVGSTVIKGNNQDGVFQVNAGPCHLPRPHCSGGYAGGGKREKRDRCLCGYDRD